MNAVHRCQFDETIDIRIVECVLSHSPKSTVVALEHVKPERLDLLHVAASAIDGKTSQDQTLRKLAFKADLL